MTAVPNTSSFNLQDIYNSVSSHASPGNNLQSCFDNAESSYFDPTYNTNSYAPANSMLRFRNYTPITAPFCAFTGSTAYVQQFYLGNEGSDPWGIYFRESDGLRFYIVNTEHSRIEFYNVSTPYTLNGAFHAGAHIIQNSGMFTDLHFSPSGNHMFLLNRSTQRIEIYNLSNPWSLSSPSYAGWIYVGEVVRINPFSFTISSDGHEVICYGISYDSGDLLFRRWHLYTPWSISGGVVDTGDKKIYTLSSYQGIHLRDDGVLFASSTSYSVNNLSVNPVNDLSQMLYLCSYNTNESIQRGIYATNTKFFVVNTITKYVREYTL